MINMFKAELYRLTKTLGFYLFWVIALGTLSLSIIMKDPGGVSLGAPMTFADDTKLDVCQVAFNFTFYFLLITPVFSIIAGEFSEHTVKNTITSGISKKMFFVEKALFTLLYCMVSFLAANYLFWGANRLINGEDYSSSIGDFSKAVLSQVPLFMAIVSVFIFVAFLFKKGAAFNAVTILTPILITTVELILYGIEKTKSVAEKLLKYELSSMIHNLALGCDGDYRAKCYIFSAAAIAVSFVFGYLCFTKTEIE